MRFPFLFLIVCSASLSFAQESPVKTVAEIGKMPNRFVAQAKYLSRKGIELDNQLLRSKAFAILESCFDGEALGFFEEKVDSGLDVGWQLANTSNFLWAFPLWPNEERKIELVSCCDDSAQVRLTGAVIIGPSFSEAEFYGFDYDATFYLVKGAKGWRISRFVQSLPAAAASKS